MACSSARETLNASEVLLDIVCAGQLSDGNHGLDVID